MSEQGNYHEMPAWATTASGNAGPAIGFAACRQFAIEYFKTTGEPVFEYVNRAQRIAYVDQHYVTWLENELAISRLKEAPHGK